MFYVYILILIILGMLAAADFLEKKIPQSKEALGFLKPYSGWLGLAAVVLGLIWLIEIVFHLGTLLKHAPIITLISLLSLALLMILGFILSQSVIKQLFGKNEKITNFTNKVVDKFTPLAEKLGLVAIGVALLNLLMSFVL